MDTTAKVDIRKLQLLNDRIAQTIDALNQVRLSVHGLGLSHTGAVPGVGFGGVPVQGVPFYGQGVSGVPQQQMFSSWPAMASGFSHSSPFGYAQQYSPYGQAFSQQQHVNPLLWQMAWQQGLGGGLSHTSPADLLAAASGVAGHSVGYHHAIGLDPITATRIMQMFPFAQMPISPIQ